MNPRALPAASSAAFSALGAFAVTTSAWGGMIVVWLATAVVGVDATFAIAAGQLALVATAIVAARIARRDRRALGLARPSARHVIAAALIGTSAWYVNMRLVAVLPIRIEDGGALDRVVSLPPLWLVVLAVAVVPAVCEEIVFRGVLLRGLATRLVPWAAVATSAMAFSLYHLNPLQMVPTLTLGLVLAVVALRAGSAIPGMVTHALNNGIAVLATRHQLPGLMTRDDSGLLDRAPTLALIVAVAVVAGGLGLALTAPRGAA